MADTISYFFKFSTNLAAEHDPVVGPYLVPGNPANFYNPIDVFNLAFSSVNVVNGFWCLVYTSDDLTTHPALQFAVDQFDQQVPLGGARIVKNNLVWPVVIQNFQVLSQGRINHYQFGLETNIVPPQPPPPPPPVPPSLASIVGPVPATFNMLWWTAIATFTDFKNGVDDANSVNDYYGFVNASINNTSVIAPDLTSTAQHLAETGAFGNHTVNTLGGAHPIGWPVVNSTSALSWRVGVIAKAAERARIVVEWGNNLGGSATSVGFDLSGVQTGYDNVSGTNTTILATSIKSLGNGWCLCTFDFSFTPRPPASCAWLPQIYIDAGSGTAARNINYTGSNGSGVDLWWFSILPIVSWPLKLTFNDDFTSLSTIDIHDTRAPGFNWYTHNTWPNAAFNPPPQPADTQQPPTPLGVLTLSSPSVLRIYNPNNNVASYTSQIMSACTDGANGYVGHAFNGPCVMDAYLTWDPSIGAPFVPLPTLWPSFWSESVEMRANFNLDASGHYIETDFLEGPFTGPPSTTVHSDKAIPPTALNAMSSPNFTISTYPAFTRMSMMWITMAANDGIFGSFISFVNGQYHMNADFAYSTTIPAGSAYYACDGHHLPVILITSENTTNNPGGGWPFFIDWVKVYTP